MIESLRQDNFDRKTMAIRQTGDDMSDEQNSDTETTQQDEGQAKTGGFPDFGDFDTGDFATDIVNLLKTEGGQFGVKITEDLDGLAEYIRQRVDHLALAVGEPGYRRAVIAERNSIAMFAAQRSVGVARDLDSRILSIIQGGISIAVRAIVPSP